MDNLRAGTSRQLPGDASGGGVTDLRGHSPGCLAREQWRQAASPLSSLVPNLTIPNRQTQQAIRFALPPRPTTPSLKPRDSISDASSFYLDDADADAVPAPLSIVKRRSAQPAVARREQATSGCDDLRQSRSVPALRCETGTAVAVASRSPIDSHGTETPRPLPHPEFGLPPLALAGAADFKHPNHPMKWTTERLMCKGSHDTQRDAAAILRTAKTCALCGTHCCHFIALLSTTLCTSHTKSTSTPTAYADVAAESARLQAASAVQRLRQEYPHGVDAYETFVRCGFCGREVCPRCAGRCAEGLCGVVFCWGCGDCEGH